MDIDRSYRTIYTYLPTERPAPVIVPESPTTTETRLIGVCQEWVDLRVGKHAARLSWPELRAAATQADEIGAAPHRAILAAAEALMSTRTPAQRACDLRVSLRSEAAALDAAGRHDEARERERTAAEVTVQR